MNKTKTVNSNDLNTLAQSVGLDVGVELRTQVTKNTVTLYAETKYGQRLITEFQSKREAQKALLVMSTVALFRMQEERGLLA